MIFQFALFVAFVAGNFAAEAPCANGCYDSSDKGAGYRGTVSVTKNWRQCQNWASQTPHTHGYTPEAHPNSGLIRNYCRNPDNDAAPWCYTTDPEVRWEYCDLTICGECYDVSDKGAGYRGAMIVTTSGRQCQNWASQTPHSHGNTPAAHPNSGLVKNYCRNPDRSASPWCYTTDPAVRWDYCHIPICEE